MGLVHIFCCRDRFRNEDAFTRFVIPEYDDDGDLIESQFMREIGLTSGYEPMAIEREWFDSPVELISALSGFSYSDQFRAVRGDSKQVNAVICVYEPNFPEHPAKSSLDYAGTFPYNARNGEQ